MFLSNFITDINGMCEFYAKELPMVFEYDGILFPQNQIELIQKLITKHLKQYVERHGGIDNIELYTEKELQDMANKVSPSHLKVWCQFSN